MSPAVVSFEVLRFEAVPAAAGLAVLELDGRFADGGRAGAVSSPRLLVETAAGSAELPAVELVREPWSATFAVSLDALADPDAAFALVPGRGPLIALPAPSLASADDDRFVRLARTVNELRHQLTETAARAADADRLRTELGQARARAVELERRAAAAGREAAAARAERDRAVAEAAERIAAAEEDAEHRVAAVAREADERIAAAEEDAAARIDAAARDAGERVAAAVAAAEEASVTLARASAEIAALTERAETAERRALEARNAADAAHREAGAPSPSPPACTDPVGGLRWDRDEPTAPTAPVEPAATAAPAASAEPTRTLELDAEDVGAGPPEDEPEETVRVLGPRSPAARRLRPTRVIAPAPGELEPAEGDDRDDDAILPPAAVGARHIEPSTTRPSGLTSARIMVGSAVLLLFLALLLIFLGVV